MAVAEEAEQKKKEEVSRIFKKLDDYKMKNSFDISTESNNKVVKAAEQEVKFQNTTTVSAFDTNHKAAVQSDHQDNSTIIMFEKDQNTSSIPQEMPQTLK